MSKELIIGQKYIISPSLVFRADDDRFTIEDFEQLNASTIIGLYLGCDETEAVTPIIGMNDTIIGTTSPFTLYTYKFYINNKIKEYVFTNEGDINCLVTEVEKRK